MDRVTKVGLIINPLAGRGIAANTDLARRGLAALKVTKVHTGSGLMGADALKGLTYETVVYPVNSEASRHQTLAVASQLVNESLDAVLVVGGDGTLADVASVFSKTRNSPPVLGIGAGSTNAGALITCTASEIDALNRRRLEVVSVTGLLAQIDGSLVGIGFNDCVLGFTAVATVDGRLRDVDVAEKLAQTNRPGRLRLVGTSQTRVDKVSRLKTTLLGEGESVGTVIIGLAERVFVAKAITGGVCLAALVGLQAGCLVADQPLVRVELSITEVLALPPLHSTFVSFGPEEQIRVQGVRAGTGLCVDGTPLQLLQPVNIVTFEMQAEAVRKLEFVH